MSKTIMIVEDEALIAVDMEATLTDVGYRVLVAPTEPAAQRLLDQYRVDAAVLDWQLGNVSGTSVARRLRASCIPYLLCSGSPMPELNDKVCAASYLQKPFPSEVLVEAIAELMAGSASASPDT